MATTLCSTASADTITTGSVLQAAAKAIDQQTSVHVVFVAHASSSSTTEKIVADVGLTGGSETISEGKAHVAIRVTPTFGYVSGSSSGLTTLFGLTAAQAKKLGADWESWRSGTKQYSTLKADVTTSSVIALLPKAKRTTLSPDATNGVYVLTWKTAATSSIPKLSHALTLSATGSNLPIEVTETSSTGVKVKTEFSKWNDSLSVLAPPAASTIASSKIMG